jgi:hypothetical protein
MASLFDTDIRPGQVISSDLFRQFLLKLEELDTRVGALESGGSDTTGSVRMLAFNPAVQQRVGQLLEIAGVNFALPASANSLTIAGQPVSSFEAGSNSQLLRFIIPAAVSVPETGDNVEVRISNANGSHLLLYRVLPAIEIPGDPPAFVSADVVNDNGSAQPIVTGAFCRISGAGFAAEPTQNVVTFAVTTANGQVTYPPQGQQLEFDETLSDEGLIRVRVPVITEIPVGQQASVLLSVQVGAHPPASASVNVIRAP